MTAFELPTYKKIINKALVIEKGLDDARLAREKSLKARARLNDSQNQDSKPFKSKAQKLNQITTRGKVQSENVKCYKYGGPHYQQDCMARREVLQLWSRGS